MANIFSSYFDDEDKEDELTPSQRAAEQVNTPDQTEPTEEASKNIFDSYFSEAEKRGVRTPSPEAPVQKEEEKPSFGERVKGVISSIFKKKEDEQGVEVKQSSDPFVDVANSTLAKVLEDKYNKLRIEKEKEKPRDKTLNNLDKEIREIEDAMSYSSIAKDAGIRKWKTADKFQRERNIENFKGAAVGVVKSTLDGIASLFEVDFERRKESADEAEALIQQGFKDLNIPEEEQQALLEKYSPRYKRDPSKPFQPSVAETQKNAKEAIEQGRVPFQKIMETYVEDVSPTNPEFQDQIVAGIGSMAAFYVTAAATGGGSVLPSVLEALGESGNVYEENKKNGMSPIEAFSNSSKTFVANVVWNTILNKFSGIFDDIGKPAVEGIKQKVISAVKAASGEGIQEAGQQLISNTATYAEDVWEGVLESFGIGAIIGGGAKGIEISVKSDGAVDLGKLQETARSKTETGRLIQEAENIANSAYTEEGASRLQEIQQQLPDEQKPQVNVILDFYKPTGETKATIDEGAGAIPIQEVTGGGVNVAEEEKPVEEDTTRVIQESEQVLRDTYKTNEDSVYEAMSEVFAEMEIAEAGQRIFTEEGVIGVSSTFPTWIPEELRSKKLFDAVLGQISSIDSLTYPSANRTAQRALYDAILDRVDSRTGLNTSEARTAIINAYETAKQKQTKEGIKEQSKSATRIDDSSTKGSPRVTEQQKQPTTFEKSVEDYIADRTVKFRRDPATIVRDNIGRFAPITSIKPSDTPAQQIKKVMEELAINVPISKINLNTEDFRTAQGDELTGEFKSKSKLPILVKRNANGIYEVIDGNHRLARALLDDPSLDNILAIDNEAVYKELADLEEGVTPRETPPDPKESFRKLNISNIKQAGLDNVINKDGTLTLFHGSSKSNIDKIIKSGELKGFTYFAGDRVTADRFSKQAGKTTEVIQVKVDSGDVLFDGNYFTSRVERLELGADGVYRELGTVPKTKKVEEDIDAVINRVLTGNFENKVDTYLKDRTTKYRSKDLNTMEQEKELVVLHNIRGETVIKALEMGGLPVPSLAVTKTNIKFDGFGEITLLGGKNLAENVYTSDVYSRRVPRERYKINDKARQKAYKELYPFYKKYGEYEHGYLDVAMSQDDSSPENLLSEANRSTALKALFLSNKGVTVEPVIEDKSTNRIVASEQGKKYLLANKEDILNTTFNFSDVKNNSDNFKKIKDYIDKVTFSGLKTSSEEYKLRKMAYDEYFLDEQGKPISAQFDRRWTAIQDYAREPKALNKTATEEAVNNALKENGITPIEYTSWVEEKYQDIFGEKYFFNSRGAKRAYDLNNLMEYMLGRVRGEESFFYGAGTVRSKVAKKLSTIEDMKASSGMLSEDIDSMKDEFNAELSELAAKIAEASDRYSGEGLGGMIHDIDVISKELATVGANFTKLSVRRVLSNLTVRNNESLVDETYNFLKKLQNAPTEYFEAKPQRVVRIGEFAGALVNNNEDPRVIKALEKQGLSVMVYNENIEGDRQLKLEELASALDTKFRVKDDVKKITGKDITDAQEQELINLNKKIFGDDNVKITLQIMANREALGAYRDNMISIVKGQADPKETFYHEAVHKYIDVFTTRNEQVELFKAGVDKYQTEDLAQVEEMLAEDFIAYAKSREGIVGRIKGIFDNILLRINAYFGNANEIDSLYNKILQPAAKKAESKPTPTTPETRQAQQPVGTGKTKPSRLAERVQEQLEIENADLPNYNTLNLKEDAQKAVEYLENSPDKALAVSLGLINPPQGQTANAIAMATALKAKSENNFTLFAEVLNSTSLRATRAGQEIVTLRGQFNDFSPENYVKMAIDNRMKALGDKLLSTAEKAGKELGRQVAYKKAVTEKIDKETAKLKKKLKLDAVKISNAQAIIDAMRC